MRTRIGRVTQIFPNEGKVKVSYEDEQNASLKLPMITMNQEYSMPKVGERVLTMHMENGSSKGFVLGTYYNANTQPKATSGYRKDFTPGAYCISQNGSYEVTAQKGVVDIGKNLKIKADKILLSCSYGEETLENILKRIERIEDMLNLPHTV